MQPENCCFGGAQSPNHVLTPLENRPYLSCIFSRIGTIMSNLGRLAGSSFMQIFMSLQTCGEMPGGIVGRRPSSATCKYRGKDGGPQNLVFMLEEAFGPQGWDISQGRIQTCYIYWPSTNTCMKL